MAAIMVKNITSKEIKEGLSSVLKIYNQL